MTNRSNAASPTVDAANRGVDVATSRPDREWSVPMFEASARTRGETATDHLLGVFDVLDDLVNRADRPARRFLDHLGRVSSAAPETEADSLLTSEMRASITGLVSEANATDADELLLSWWVLLKGSILKALDGDLGSPMRARAMAVDLVARHMKPTFHPVAESFAERIDFDAYFDWSQTDEADRLV